MSKLGEMVREWDASNRRAAQGMTTDELADEIERSEKVTNSLLAAMKLTVAGSVLWEILADACDATSNYRGTCQEEKDGR